MKPAKVFKEVVWSRFVLKGPQVARILTDVAEKKQVIVKNQNGATMILKPHQATREIVEFLRESGNEIEYQTVETYRSGKRDFNGFRIKVYPIDHGRYDDGAILFVKEQSTVSWANSDAVLKLLMARGVEIKKECQVMEIKKVGSCRHKW